MTSNDRIDNMHELPPAEKRIRLKGTTLIIPRDSLLDMTCVLWMSNELVRAVVSTILSFAGLASFTGVVSTVIIYAPLVYYIYLEKKLPWRYFHFVFLFCAAYFLVTLLFNPSYLYWYSRDTFGVMDTIFKPYRGAIWGFLIAEISCYQKTVWKNLKIYGILLFVYNIAQWLQAQAQGYWDYMNSSGTMSTRSYSLEFGYSMAFICLMMLLLFMSKKRFRYVAVGVIALVLMLQGGSRGSLICLVSFVAIWIISSAKRASTKKLAGVAVVGVLGMVVYLFMDEISTMIISLLSKFNLSSRTLTSILSGEIADSTGRDAIHKIVLDAIKKNPIVGYGAYGDRPFVGPKYNWGYSHSVIYEMMVDFGVIIGILILAVILYYVIKLLRRNDRDEIFFSVVLIVSLATRLLVSYTFWGDMYFWMLLGIIVAERHEIKQVKLRRKR